MRFVFYITNHGFGHASRNVPIIRELFRRDPHAEVCIKSDAVRCAFLKKNLNGLIGIRYYYDCREPGVEMMKGKLHVDIRKTRECVWKDILKWDGYIGKEESFLRAFRPDIVIADIVGWSIRAAKNCGIPVLLIGNFTWETMYRSWYGKEIWEPYQKCYRLADKAIWYDIHDEYLHTTNTNYECVSLVSRDVDYYAVQKIRQAYGEHVVFVSVGGSVEIAESIFVGDLPYKFLVTNGIHLVGDNVIMLPNGMINTPDYIAASEFVIAKGGWSTMAEILLQHKKCALLFRGNNSEDNWTKQVLVKRGHCVPVEEQQLSDLKSIIQDVLALDTDSYDLYRDDRQYICDIIMELRQK